MGKVLSLIIGGIVLAAGVAGLVKWWGNFMLVLKGTMPLILIFCGIIALLAGISELKDTVRLKSKK